MTPLSCAAPRPEQTAVAIRADLAKAEDRNELIEKDNAERLFRTRTFLLGLRARQTLAAILSEEAGAADELGAASLTVSPFDSFGTREAIARALLDLGL